MRRLRRQEGLSLVEVTIMLLVLMLLTSVLAPSIMDYVKDAQWVKVKEDCEAIGISVARFTRDNGPCFRYDGTVPQCSLSNIMSLLVSDGVRATGSGEGLGTAANANINGSFSWANGVGNFDTLENHLILNSPQGNTAFAYPTPGQLGNFWAVGPQWGLGWRGAYLAPPIGPDPWGNQYMVNTLFLAPPSNPGSLLVEGGYGWDRDVFCISPGPNRVVETYFGGQYPVVAAAMNTIPMGTQRRGDDYVYVIQGSTR